MSVFYNDINSSLRATEAAAVAVDALVLPSAPTAGLPSVDAADNWHNRRVLAMVLHKDDWALSEEGALFVYKLSSLSNSSTYRPELQGIYPIYGKFSIVMSQMRRNTLDLSTTNAKAVLDQPRSGFSLKFTPAEGSSQNAEAPTFYATDVQSLGVLVAEAKRVKEAAEIEKTDTIKISQTSSHFSWLTPYVSRSTYLPLLSAIPPDLRTINKSLLERLSPASAGLPGDDATDILLIRDEWMRNKARSLVQQGSLSLTLRLGTFNVNGKLPSQDLSPWIQGVTASTFPAPNNVVPPSFAQVNALSPVSVEDEIPSNNPTLTLDSTTSNAATSDPDPDVLAIGFQEVDLSTEALIYSTGSSREDAWCLAIFAALGEKAVQYEKLVSKQLVGMLLVILVKKSLKSCFGDIRVASAGSGILGVMGNKGATAARVIFTPPLNAKGTPSRSSMDVNQYQDDAENDENRAGSLTLTFVNAHLAAFDEMVDRRNQEFHELSRRLMFGSDLSELAGSGAYEDDFGAQPPQPSPISIYQTDALFWMVRYGRNTVAPAVLTFASILDLNYRVDIPDSEFRQLLAEKEWDNRLPVLLRYDQLRKSMSSAKAFDGFLESPISHLPSYRFSPGMGTDALGYDQKRRPAWTDRILHISNSACNVKQQSYDCYPQITMSDHRPVAATYSLQFDLCERSRYESSVKELYHEMQVLDSSHERPTVKVDQSFLDFGEIRFDSRSSKKVVIENVGKVPCAWRFVPAQSESPIHPDWLLIEPTAGMFLPGEKIEISMAIHMDKRIISSLNLGPRDMSGTLILHTVLGKDHFIAISGEYLPSCFGNKLTTLTRLPGSIRSLTSSKELRAENYSMNAPGEIMRLVNRLMSNTEPPEDLFLQPPDEEMVATVREYLDTGDEFPWPPGENENEVKVSHAFAHTLLRLLDSLIEPIVPPILHSRCVQMTSRDGAFELLDALQPAAVNVWITVTAFLHFICQSSTASGYPGRIADLFTAILMRDDPESTTPPISPIGKRKFFLHFIT